MVKLKKLALDRQNFRDVCQTVLACLARVLEQHILQGCSKGNYKPGNHRSQAGSWLKNVPSLELSGEVFYLASPRGGGGRVRGHIPPENFENQRSQIG